MNTLQQALDGTTKYLQASFESETLLNNAIQRTEALARQVETNAEEAKTAVKATTSLAEFKLATLDDVKHQFVLLTLLKEKVVPSQSVGDLLIKLVVATLDAALLPGAAPTAALRG